MKKNREFIYYFFMISSISFSGVLFLTLATALFYFIDKGAYLLSYLCLIGAIISFTLCLTIPLIKLD